MRDNAWLQEQLDHLLETYFADVALNNPVEIKFGREAKFRFGSIRLVKPRGLRRASLALLGKLGPQKSAITVTSLFVRESVPVKVVQYTIVHELCHYAHGFSSTNKRLFKYPHHGGVVNRELKERGAEELIGAFKKWLKDYRVQIMAGQRTRI